MVEPKNLDVQKNTSAKNSVEKSVPEEISVIFTEEAPVLNNEENNGSANIVEQNTSQLFINIKPNPEDSGLFSADHSKKESGSSDSSGEFLISEEANNSDRSPAPSEPQKNSPLPENMGNIHLSSTSVCVKLCNLIKAQLGENYLIYSF